ncbi:MAG TPA: iron uptake transporter permease EfeU [Nocardioides sp.]|jgi:high-affinity iron transporter|uniref:iron uptake transporter permease EfeU n=1 Tax=Nocardioides sp. TaxID=35761 RepID=UPI002E359D85|nr:iron uptake transporter permease EfeU [Nocardioides sp.]HEX3929183.1 iron uptake transporter permease EfeU [Nocardioides sp.]
MLPTFVIGLREGLEAVLVVTIIATFLRRNGASLRPMWYGVTAAVALSIGVGVTLKLIEQNLPQRQQEGMETVIGLVAVGFVTGMVLWMSTHARFMKRELEGAAQRALSNGTSAALVAMVFLAVLREGFETSVFLLATFQAASSELSAFVGAVLGILAAIVLGYAMFSGGVRINLGRFFTVTSVFLILVAAGLVLSALRTGHEASWVTIGQGRTVDLSWLAPTGSVRAALVSGVLGMPADPRVVELLGWACYLVPMLALTLWPSRLRPPAALMPRARLAGAGVLAAVAVVLALVVPLPHAEVPASAPVAGGGTATIDQPGTRAGLEVSTGGSHHTVALVRGSATSGALSGTTSWSSATAGTTPTLPATLTLTQLLRFTGQRVPVGLDIGRSPGPYRAAWNDRTTVVATTYDGGLVSAAGRGDLVLTLTSGGLTSERVLTVSEPGVATSWHVPASYTAQVESRISAAQTARGDRTLWKYWLPGFLVVLAGWLGLTGLRGRRARRAAPTPAPGGGGAPDAPPADAGRTGRKHHVSTSG